MVCRQSVVRANAGKWGVAPDRILMVGFQPAESSPETMLAENPTSNRAYWGSFMARPQGCTGIRKHAPHFLPWRRMTRCGARIKFFNALRDAKANPELHVYRAGAQFAMMPRKGTNDHWIDQLYWWMESFGLTRP